MAGESVTFTAHPMKKILLLAILGLLAIRGFAEKIELGGNKALVLTLPATWTGTGPVVLPPGMPARGINVRYVTKNGSNDAVLLTILTVPDDRLSDRESLRALFEKATEQFVSGSVEAKADIKELRLAGATGFCATFTDASLVGKPSVKDDFKVVTSCFIYLGEQVMLTATIFTDDPAGPAYAEGMRLLKSVSLELPKNKL